MKPQTKIFAIIGIVILLIIISLSLCLFYTWYDQKPTTKPLKEEAEVIDPDSGLDAIDESTSVDHFIQEDDTSVHESIKSLSTLNKSLSTGNYFSDDDNSFYADLEDGNYFEDQKEDSYDGIQSDGHDSIQDENHDHHDSDTTQNVAKLNHIDSAELDILVQNCIETPVNNSNSDQTPHSFNSDQSDGSFIQV